MSAQIFDNILIQVTKYPVYGSPLDEILKERGLLLFSLNQQLGRGYVASWKLEGKKLWLTDFYGENNFGGKVYSMVDLFSEGGNEFFAYWFTGNIRIPIGKKIGFTNSLTGPIYESETSLYFKSGILEDSGTFQL